MEWIAQFSFGAVHQSTNNRGEKGVKKNRGEHLFGCLRSSAGLGNATTQRRNEHFVAAATTRKDGRSSSNDKRLPVMVCAVESSTVKKGLIDRSLGGKVSSPDKQVQAPTCNAAAALISTGIQNNQCNPTLCLFCVTPIYKRLLY